MRNSFFSLMTWLFSLERSTKSTLLIIADVLVIPVALLSAFLVRLESVEFLFDKDTYLACLIAVFSTIFVFHLRGLYSALTRYFSLDALATIIFGGFVTTAVLVASIYTFSLQIPRSVPLIFCVLTIFLSTGFRIGIRQISRNLSRGKKLNIAIYGAGTSGAQLMEALKWSPGCNVCLFIDDDPKLTGRTLGGVSISSFNNTKEKFNALKIDTLLLAAPITLGDTRTKILNLLSEYPFQVKFIPSVSSLMKSSSALTEMRDINIEDLLGREPVEPDAALMTKTVTGKSVSDGCCWLYWK